MNGYVARLLIAVSLMGATGHAMAIPIWKVQRTFYQDDGNGRIYAGLVLEAQTFLALIGVGGDFTIQCGTSSVEIKAGNFETVINPAGARATVYVPNPSPGLYTIPNWSSIPAGTCGGVGHCAMHYRVEGREDVIDIGRSGFSFGRIPSGQMAQGDTLQIDICR